MNRGQNRDRLTEVLASLLAMFSHISADCDIYGNSRIIIQYKVQHIILEMGMHIRALDLFKT